MTEVLAPIFPKDSEVSRVEWATIEGSRQEGCYTPRVYHSAIRRRDKIYVFGGSAGFSFLSNPYLNDLYEFNCRNSKWSLIKPRSTLPPPRAGHAMVAHRKRIHIFGGTGANGTLMNDLWSYDPEDNVWGRRTYQGSLTPAPRAFHSALLYGDLLIVYGGRGDEAAGTVWLLNMTTKTWVRTEAIPARGSKSNLLPRPRFKHSAIIMGNMMYIFGGVILEPDQPIPTMKESGDLSAALAPTPEVCSELWVYNIDLNTFTEIKSDLAVPAPRAEHASALLGSRWIIHGGRTNAHVMTTTAEGAGAQSAPHQVVLADTWALHLSTQQWTLLCQGVVHSDKTAEDDKSDEDLRITARWGHHILVSQRGNRVDEDSFEKQRRSIMVLGGMTLASVPVL